MKKAAEAAHKCLCSGRAGARGDARGALEELERKVLELNEHQQMVHKHKGKKKKNAKAL